ncbi:hypothetical protein KUTeg_018736, partial [Tegillarca granosa]
MYSQDSLPDILKIPLPDILKDSLSNSQSGSTSIKIRMSDQPPQIATQAVLVKTDTDSYFKDVDKVEGYDFNQGINYHELLKSYRKSGFQATNFGKAVEEINKMIDKKLQPVPKEKLEEINLNPCGREKTNCSIFLGYTSNLISAGVREQLRYLVEHNMGSVLREKGINRIGNLLVPNDNYCLFEDWLMPILDTMLKEQKEEGTLWTPSKLIARLGKEINDPKSVYYWAYKNNIPVFCPAIIDGSLGDMLYFHSYKNPGLVLDLVEDIRRMNSQAVYAINTGMIIVGGGVIKHHICNANLMRNGADFCVYLNTASEFDGSDSGASPDEAVSWGKIKKTASPVKICGEATLILPLLIAETFAQR